MAVPPALRPLVDDPRHAALFVDFDGSLAPIVDDPAAARPLPAARDALARLVPLARPGRGGERPAGRVPRRRARRSTGSCYVGALRARADRRRRGGGRRPRAEPWLDAIAAAADEADAALPGPAASSARARSRSPSTGATQPERGRRGARRGPTRPRRALRPRRAAARADGGRAAPAGAGRQGHGGRRARAAARRSPRSRATTPATSPRSPRCARLARRGRARARGAHRRARRPRRRPRSSTPTSWSTARAGWRRCSATLADAISAAWLTSSSSQVRGVCTRDELAQPRARARRVRRRASTARVCSACGALLEVVRVHGERRFARARRTRRPRVRGSSTPSRWLSSGPSLATRLRPSLSGFTSSTS